MTHRGVCAAIGMLWLAAAATAGQTPAAPVQDWTLSRTAWGDPDLQAAWSFAAYTALERPARYAARERLTEEEIAALDEEASTGPDRRQPLPGESTPEQRALHLDASPYNAFWYDSGRSTGRTALIVDPTDGRIPFTPEGRQRREARWDLLRRPAHGPEDRTPGERCAHSFKAGPPMTGGSDNNHLRLLQAPGYVAVWTENIHDARIVPLDGRPRIADAIRQWMGDSRGRWDGDTLVVETTNFNGKSGYQGSADDLHVVERFTRTGPETLEYVYTVAGTDTYARPWTASLTMKRLDADLYEFACHEGNYGLEGILAGARADERTAK